MARRKKEKEVPIEEFDSDRELVEGLIAEKEYYLESSLSIRNNWTEYFKQYNSILEKAKNPFLSNLFIPKTHEAVELLTAFLVGANQSIFVSPEGADDILKAPIVQKRLEFLWNKELKVRDLLVKYVKQAIIFGNGIMKIGWNAEEGKPTLAVRPLSDIYFSYFHSDSRESPWIFDRIIRRLKDVKEDKRYKVEIRNRLVGSADFEQDEPNTPLYAQDSTRNVSPPEDNTEILECWGKDGKFIALGQTRNGWEILRKIRSPYKDEDGNPIRPFVKLRFKANPLPNRAYDIGMIQTTQKIQKAFNDSFNEFFDNVSLVNNKMWIKKRNSGINPMDLVRRPGGIITVNNDINSDIRSEEIGDVKASLLALIGKLDSEFQQASMVVNLLKAIPGAVTATEAALGQQNVQNMLDIIDRNIKDAMSEIGYMLLNIDIQHASCPILMKVLENERNYTFVEYDPKEIRGKYDVKISADRTNVDSRAVAKKQLMDLLAVLSRDQITLQKYPNLPEKLYREWMRLDGKDPDSFFQQAQQTQQAPQRQEAAGVMPGSMPGAPFIAQPRGEQLTPAAIRQAALSPAIKSKTN